MSYLEDMRERYSARPQTYAAPYIKALEAHVAELKGILDAALNYSVANRGQPNAFYGCHTLPLGRFPMWVLEAETVLATKKGNETWATNQTRPS